MQNRIKFDDCMECYCPKDGCNNCEFNIPNDIWNSLNKEWKEIL